MLGTGAAAACGGAFGRPNENDAAEDMSFRRWPGCGEASRDPSPEYFPWDTTEDETESSRKSSKLWAFAPRAKRACGEMERAPR